MTSKISLFNKGIYKSTVKRYLWGSLVYFALLFLTTCVSILLSERELSGRLYVDSEPLILGYGYTVFPILLTFGVSAVTAVLVYRFAHSRKTALFIHSLPVSRTENFVSSLLGGFTLMGVPVILNGLFLMVISLCGYGRYFDVTSCLVWIGINLLALFLFFSCSTFAATITGHTVGAIVINILLHCFLFILTGGFLLLAEAFLYGYSDYSVIMNSITEWNFVVYVFDKIIGIGEIFDADVSVGVFDWLRLLGMIGTATGLYVLSWFLYKKRRMENAGYMAAFKCLNPVFKYMIILFVTLISFGTSISSWKYNAALTIVPIIIQSSVAYFGVEMILKKSVKIWSSYKGYLAFVVAFSAIVCVFAFTSFFGFETRVPASDSVEGVRINTYTDWYGGTYVEDKEAIKYITDFHRSYLQKGIPVLSDSSWHSYTDNVEIEYKLKNGGTMKRKYDIPQTEIHAALDDLYEIDAFKKSVEEVFGVKDESILKIEGLGDNITDKEVVSKLMSCIRQDMMELNYTQIYNESGYRHYLTVVYEVKGEEWGGSYNHTMYMNLEINSNFKRTMQWIRENTAEIQTNAKNSGN